MTPYDWILLDADNTLFDYNKAESVALENTLTHFGISGGPQALEAYRRVNGALWQAFERGEVDQETIKIQRFRALLAELTPAATPAIDASDVAARYLVNLSHGNFLLDGALELVTSLANRFQLAVLTNGLTAVQRARISKSPLLPYLQHIIISEEVGASKPRPDIFDIAFSRMGQPARRQVLMVGDSLTSDMRGGHDYGLDTCWYNPAGDPNDSGIPLTYEIQQLADLPPLLGL
jgi:YjjG family noncanonical pyrimidine nucleotidase